MVFFYLLELLFLHIKRLILLPLVMVRNCGKLASWIWFLCPPSGDAVALDDLSVTSFHKSCSVGSTHRRRCLYFSWHRVFWWFGMSTSNPPKVTAPDACVSCRVPGSCGGHSAVGWKWSRALSTAASLLPCWLANILPDTGKGLVLPLLPVAPQGALCSGIGLPIRTFLVAQSCQREIFKHLLLYMFIIYKTGMDAEVTFRRIMEHAWYRDKNGYVSEVKYLKLFYLI